LTIPIKIEHWRHPILHTTNISRLTRRHCPTDNLTHSLTNGRLSSLSSTHIHSRTNTFLSNTVNNIPTHRSRSTPAILSRTTLDCRTDIHPTGKAGLAMQGSILKTSLVRIHSIRHYQGTAAVTATAVMKTMKVITTQRNRNERVSRQQLYTDLYSILNNHRVEATSRFLISVAPH
jgi:hypothetical protein